MGWVRAIEAEWLARKGKAVVKLDGGRQVALFATAEGVRACANRCPHEGYPLVEGTLDEAGCVLTCNWHNWKFDLATGATLVGGDTLRIYPAETRDGAVWVDLTDLTAERRIAAALGNLRGAVERHEYDRLARSVARLVKAGGDPLDAVRAAIGWTAAAPEFGMTHALAAAPEWLALADRFDDPADRLACWLEVLGHLAWDAQGEPARPFPEGTAPWDPAALVAAIEREDEAAAAAVARGGLAAGLGFAGFERTLTEAALAHYQDFGHSLIYVVKAGALIDRLGPSVAEPVLLALVRSMVTASREDLIPEFRGYALRLARWDGRGEDVPNAEYFAGRSVNAAMDLTLAGSADPRRLYHALFGAAADNLLRFDLSRDARRDGPVSQNVGWLDFTHGLTFANAVRLQCVKFPDLWPQGLLQLACFVGRNAAFTDRTIDPTDWQVPDPAAFLDATLARMIDHGQGDYILSAHFLKTTSALAEEVAATPDAAWVALATAALNRFLAGPHKRRHVARTARQALDFVMAEG